MHRRIPYQRALQKNAASPTLSLDANDMKATSRNNARSPFLPRQALSNESVPMGGALVRLMQMAGPNEQALTIRKSPPTLFVLFSPWEPFLPPWLIRLACPYVLSLKPYASTPALPPTQHTFPTYMVPCSPVKKNTDKIAIFPTRSVCGGRVFFPKNVL